MDTICILKNGLAVKLPSIIFQNLEYNIDGFLIGFEYKQNGTFVKFHFYFSDDFKNERFNGKSFVPEGYYLEEKAILFFSYQQSTAFTQSVAPTPDELKEIYCFKYYDFETKYPANFDDQVTITSINSSLYEFIYEENIAVFKIIKNDDDSTKLHYLKANGKIDFPVKNEPGNGFVSYELSQLNNFLDVNRSNHVKQLGYFYQKNFSERVSGWLATTDTIQRMDRITTLIVLRINQIRKEIFPLLIDQSGWSIIDAAGIQSGITINDLNTDLLKILYEIKKGWAMFYYPDNPQLNQYTPILPNEGHYPNYEAYEKYYNSLINFYRNCYRIKPHLLNATNDQQKLELLIKCLGPSSLQIIPLDLRINILVEFAKGKIYEDKENLILKIVESIDPTDATEFLAKLQSTVVLDGKKDPKLFEALYDKINDQIVWFGKDNRKALMLKLFNLWYVSEYNPSISTNDFEDTNQNNLDDIESELIGFTENTVMLNYKHEKFFGFYTDNMSFDFENGKIKVSEEKIRIISTVNVNSSGVQKYWEKIGSYNYLQAVSLSDYKENDVAIKIPLVDLNQNGENVTALLPLFYLKYMDDYGDSEDLWTGIGLTFDVALTFTGVGNLTKLRHLRHVGKFGRVFRAWRNGTQTTETLFIIKGLWQGAQGVAGLAEITSSFVSIYLTYTTSNCNDYKNQVYQNINDNTPNGQLPDEQPHISEAQKEYNRCRKLDQIMFWIQIGSLGLDLLASKKIKKYSKELQDLGYPSSWNIGDYLQLKQKFQGINAAGLDNFQNFINQIPVAYRANVETKLLNDFDVDQRMLFLDDFTDANLDEAFWQKMMNNGGEAMDNYRNLRVHNISDAKSFEIITNSTLTNRYIDYYNVPALKNQLEKFDDASRLEFLKSPLSQVTPLPGSGYLNAWLKMKKDGKLANFQTETFLRQFDDFSDELVDKAVHEMTHADRGAGIRQLITESPDDIKNVMKKVLEEPNNAKTFLRETDNVDWKKWGDTQFFKHYTQVGKKFENFLTLRFAIRNSAEYNMLQNWFTSNNINKNLDNYDLLGSVQLRYGNGPNDYFVADQVFVKYEYVGDFKRIDDIIVIETKLTAATKTSGNQKNAINMSYEPNFNGFDLRNIEKKSLFDKTNIIDREIGKFKFNGVPTIIKAEDLETGNALSNFKRLTNLDNN